MPWFHGNPDRRKSEGPLPCVKMRDVGSTCYCQYHRQEKVVCCSERNKPGAAPVAEGYFHTWISAAVCGRGRRNKAQARISWQREPARGGDCITRHSGPALHKTSTLIPKLATNRRARKSVVQVFRVEAFDVLQLDPNFSTATTVAICWALRKK